jgi:hypothetical protein
MKTQKSTKIMKKKYPSHFPHGGKCDDLAEKKHTTNKIIEFCAKTTEKP